MIAYIPILHIFYDGCEPVGRDGRIIDPLSDEVVPAYKTKRGALAAAERAAKRYGGGRCGAEAWLVELPR